jgi:putative two-component system hydrogenase maturation factor HypX/HoxX
VRRIRPGEAPISVHNIDVERRLASADFVKLPATLAFVAESAALPESPLSGWWKLPASTWQDIAYEEFDGVGFLHFEFYNGAMSSRQCERLREALTWARTRPTKVLVLMGGEDFWSNGIHLNVIEKAESPADESWRNINAIDDLALDLIENRDQITVAAVGGNTGAGGCFLARAADLMWVRDGAILNPHYKNMGNLYGSEYWTYLLPRRVGEEGARRIMRDRLPLTAQRAVETGFADAALAGSRDAWRVDVARRAAEIAAAPDFAVRLEDKRTVRERDEAARPLAEYRAGELAQMRRNFYGFDPSYHVARFHFVVKSLASWTPRHLARHRDLGWKVPA